TDAEGRFFFQQSIKRGRYSVSVHLEGFTTGNFEVVLDGRRDSFEFTLDVAPMDIGDVIERLLPWQGVEQETTHTEQQLRDIPVARDPWAALLLAPGVLSDRINIGGVESGHASMYVGPGASPEASSFLVDKVIITDSTSPGTSPIYFDFTL